MKLPNFITSLLTPIVKARKSTGKKKGEIALIKTPAGQIEFEVVDISM